MEEQPVICRLFVLARLEVKLMNPKSNTIKRDLILNQETKNLYRCFAIGTLWKLCVVVFRNNGGGKHGADFQTFTFSLARKHGADFQPLHLV